MRRTAAIALLVALSACDGDASTVGPTRGAPAPAVDPEPPTADATASFIDVDAEHLDRTLADHPARVLLVNVWSTWCEPCVEEMPALVAFATEHRDEGLGLALIAADPPSQRDAAWAFLDSVHAPTPRYFKVGPDDAFITAVHEDWQGGLPATLLLDERREVLQFWERPVTPDDLRAPVASALHPDELPPHAQGETR
ncbi:MAG: TlpA disulfide reductase family protein [Sandaracinaceae bacterium]